MRYYRKPCSAPWHLETLRRYTSTDLNCEDLGDGRCAWTISPVESDFHFSTDRRIPRLGWVVFFVHDLEWTSLLFRRLLPEWMSTIVCRIMLVGLGGNNGSTLVGGVIANREGITWKTKEGVRVPNYFGSLTQSSTCRVGSVKGQEVFTPFKTLLPMVNPNEIFTEAPFTDYCLIFRWQSRIINAFEGIHTFFEGTNEGNLRTNC